MTYSELFESFWVRYGSEDSLKNKGAKRKAYEAWKSVGAKWSKEEKKGDFDEQEFAQMVWRGYDATIRNRKAARLAKQFTPTLPHVVTWLNQWRFEEEQPVTTADYKGMIEERQCSCGNGRVIGRSATGRWVCAECELAAWYAGETHMGIRPSLKPLVAEMPRNEGETWREWSIRYLSRLPVGRKLLERYGI